MVAINFASVEPLYVQIYNQIAEGIEEGLYRPGEKMTSISRSSIDLGVSRNTVEKAYDLLVRSGYLESRRGSGYRVTGNLQRPVAASQESESELLGQLREKTDQLRDEAGAVYDFSYSTIDHDVVPVMSLERSLGEMRYLHDREEMWKRGDIQGFGPLREQIARYLALEGGARVAPEQIIIASSRRVAIEIAISQVPSDHAELFIQDPGCVEIRACARDMGYEIHPLRINSEFSFALPDKVRFDRQPVAYVTPGSLFPLNKRLEADERQSLLEWAYRYGAYLIEDEYCHEFHNDLHRLSSVRALDERNMTITVGTFSRSLGPYLCVNFVVLPPDLMLNWIDQERNGYVPESLFNQAVIASYMETGGWKRQLRRMQKANLKKYHLLLESLDEVFGDTIETLDFSAGSHLLLRTKDGRREDELIELARARGVRVYPTSRYWEGPMPDDWDYVLLGYSGIPLSSIQEAVRQLGEAWLQ